MYFGIIIIESTNNLIQINSAIRINIFNYLYEDKLLYIFCHKYEILS